MTNFLTVCSVNFLLIGVPVNSIAKINTEREISDGLKYSSQLLTQSSKSLHKAQNVGAAEELGFGSNLLLHCQKRGCIRVGVCLQGWVWISCYLGCESSSAENWTHPSTWVTWDCEEGFSIAMTWGGYEEVDSELPCLWFGTFYLG